MMNTGIDVSKNRLDVAQTDATGVTQSLSQSFSNDPAGIKQLCDRLIRLRPERVVLEATGGYERAAVAELLKAGLPVAVVNPRQVRDFARATGRLAKTDRIDAQVLASFAQTLKPPIRPLPDAQAQALQELVGRRRQLVQMRTAEGNRLAQAGSARVRRSLEQSIAFIDEQLSDLDDELDALIRACPAWQEKADLLKSVPGIGDQTARALVAELPELGTCSRQQIAALAGVAPINRDSGTHRGNRSIWGGRATVRSALYMATLVATRFNPIIRLHYQRMLKAGKLRKVALVACMRKLLTILNAMLRDSRAWKMPAAA